MKHKKAIGIRCFAITYNVLGIMGLVAVYVGFKNVLYNQDYVSSHWQLMQTLNMVTTAMFFISSFLLFRLNRIGKMIPVFLLTVLLTDGFVVLCPLLIGHLVFFTRPQVISIFS